MTDAYLMDFVDATGASETILHETLITGVTVEGIEDNSEYLMQT